MTTDARLDHGRLFGRALIAGLIAGAAVQAIALGARLLLGMDDFQQLALGPPFVFTVLGVLAGAVLIAILWRLVDEPLDIFRKAVPFLIVISWAPDLALLSSEQPGVTNVSVGVLMLLHVVAALIAVPMLMTAAGADDEA